MTPAHYAKQHLKIFPCYKTKAPATSNGFHDASDNIFLAESIFTNEAPLIGLPCGAINNIAVVDFDLYKIELSFEELKASISQSNGSNKINFPDTLTVQTQSGGIHLYYKIDPKKGSIPSVTKAFGSVLPVDIRGDGGYIIAPDNKLYVPIDVEIEDLQKDFMSLLTDAPDWIYNFRKPQEISYDYLDSLPESECREIQSALAVLSSDDRDRWVTFGLALKNTGSSKGYELWNEWSKKSTKYNEEDQIAKWESFKPKGDITIASIFDLAKKAGWTTTYKKVTEIDLDEIDEKKNHEKQPFPKELLNPPGLVGAIIQHIDKFSKNKQPILALGASLAACGTIMGQRYQTDQGLRTNLYILGVADSGSGKEAARFAVKKLFEAANIGQLAATEDLASDAAILTAIEKAPSQLFLFDEIGRFLKTTNQVSSKNAHLYNIISIFLKIYGSANQVFRGKAYADSEKQKIIDSPNLCIYGTTVPKTLYEGLNVENLIDGFLSRFMIFESEDNLPTPSGRKKFAMQTVDENLIQKVKEIYAMPRNVSSKGNMDDTVNPMIVKMHQDAELMLEEYERYIFEKRVDLKSQGRIDATYNRSVQFAEQISLILAVGKDHLNPVITADEVEYAINLVNYLSDRMAHIGEHFIARNDYEHEGKRVLNLIRDSGKKGITQSELTRKTQNLKTYERNDLLATLEESGQIMSAVDGKTKYFYPKKIKYNKEVT